MRSRLFSKTKFGILAVSTLLGSANAQANSKTPAAEEVSDLSRTSASAGPRLRNPGATLKAIYPSMTRSTEQSFLPAQNGGSTFGGLVGRLLGEAPKREFEGLDVRRHLYHVFAGDRKVGVAHGSTVDVQGLDLDVFVFYDPTGKILDVRLENMPGADANKLAEALVQFRGRDATDFEVIRGRRGRIVSRGAFLSHARRPADSRVQPAFERVLRAVRFNAAFMDVAYFIKEHPDLADDNRIAMTEAVSGPEAFIRSREVAANQEKKPEEKGTKARP